MPPTNASVFVDLLGFLTGIALYVMLVAMVWRERAAEGAPLWSRAGRLPLLTGLCGLIWNIGALVSIGIQMAGAAVPLVAAAAFGALGFLPAVVVHSLLNGRASARRRGALRPTIAVAYVLSATASVLHLSAALAGQAVPSRPALWLLTLGFTVLAAWLLAASRHQPIGRRGLWIAALSIFAVSALHFGRHEGNEAWWVELLGHHASLPLVLTILIQDYRFALADLFLKHAISLLLLVGLSFGVFSAVILPLLGRDAVTETWPPGAIAVVLVFWVGTVLSYPWFTRAAALLVDRAVLRRPDYGRVLDTLAVDLESLEHEVDVVSRVAATVRQALGASEVRVVSDAEGAVMSPALPTAAVARAQGAEPGRVAVLTLRTVDPPHPSLAIGPLVAGRRLLSDDLHWLEGVGRLAARRLDALRVARERLARNLREQEMERFATEAELRALRAQLQPHFLFNALTTIGHLIQQAPPRALDTLLRLTSVLRGVLRRTTSEFATLGEEMDLITSYLDIEQARFEERLRVEIEVPAEARSLLVPTLLLQPLVENAVRHGIGTRMSGGIVSIRATVDRAVLRIDIRDSGMGFDTKRPRRDGGVGLRSVYDRLRVHYGADAGLAIESEQGRGTRVSLYLPASVGVPEPTRLVG